MKIKNLMFMTSVLAIFNPLMPSSNAVTTASGLPDHVTLEIFSFMTPAQLSNKLEVSREFRRLACDKNSPLGQLNNHQESKDLYTFCRKMEFEFGEVLALANKVVAMKVNPAPKLISEKEFKDAKHYAQQLVDDNF